MTRQSGPESAAEQIGQNDACAREHATGAPEAHGAENLHQERAGESAQGTQPRPPRGYTWPPFEDGNTAAVTHGANSSKLVEPRAREIAPAVLDANPHLDPLRDGAAVFRYGMGLARIERVYLWLAAQDDAVFADAKQGEAHGVYERLERWERQAAADEERLAIAPLTRARLGLDLLRGQALTEEQRRQQTEARKRLDERMDGGGRGGE